MAAHTVAVTPRPVGVFNPTLHWLLFALVVAGGCEQQPPPKPRFAYSVEASCPAANSDEFFLPRGVLFTGPEQDDRFWRAEFSRLFHAMSAQPLGCGAAAESYRFSRLPPAHAPVVVLLSKAENEAWMLFRTDFAGRNPLGMSVVKSMKRLLSREEGQRFITDLDSAGFWSRRPQPWPKPEDGLIWLIEGRAASGYQAVAGLERNDDQLQVVAKQILALSAQPQ